MLKKDLFVKDVRVFKLKVINVEKKNLINCKKKECLFFCNIVKISAKIFIKKETRKEPQNSITLNFIKSKKKLILRGKSSLEYLRNKS